MSILQIKKKVAILSPVSFAQTPAEVLCWPSYVTKVMQGTSVSLLVGQGQLHRHVPAYPH